MPDNYTPSGKLPAAGALLLAQVRYQAGLLLSSGRIVAICVGLPVILLVAGGTTHGHATPSGVASDATFGLTLVAWNGYGVRLVAAREAGVLKRWRATPLPRWSYFSGRILATVVVGVLPAAVTVAVGAGFYHLHLSVDAALGILVIFALGAAAWAAAATVLTSAMPTVEAATPILTLIYFPVIIVSGVFGSISEPHWLATFAGYLPAKPLIGAATMALSHSTGGLSLPAHDLVVLAVWTAVGLAVAVVTFRWEPHRPTRHGAARPAKTPATA
jgi:ABC-2 type transport system permease protein